MSSFWENAYLKRSWDTTKWSNLTFDKAIEKFCVIGLLENSVEAFWVTGNSALFLKSETSLNVGLVAKFPTNKRGRVITLLTRIPQTLQTVQKLLSKCAKQKRPSDNFVRREFPTKLYKAQQNLFRELAHKCLHQAFVFEMKSTLHTWFMVRFISTLFKAVRMNSVG